MAITYNPYNWTIKQNPDIMIELLSKKEQERDFIIEELQNYDISFNHISISKIIEDLYEIQQEINDMWLELENKEGKLDIRPFFENVEYYSD